jgi:DNA-nicking Smr family endonuclease
VVKKQKDQLLDDQMFRQEMTGVVPLKTAPTTDSKAPRSVNTARKPEDFSSSPDHSYLASADEQGHIDSEDGSSHRKNGIQKRTMQKLKRGQYKVGAELDLHNMTMETGRTALLEFIAESQSGSLESVRIIHGKGLRSENGPRLKLMTRQSLRDHSQVLAYTSCKPADGGDGAVDVLLKSS